MNRGGGESEDERPPSVIRGPRDPRASTRRSATTPLPAETAPTSYRQSDQPPSSYIQRPSSQNTTRRSLPQAPQRSNTAPVTQPHQSSYDTDDSDDIYVNDDDQRHASSPESPSFPTPQHHIHEGNRLHIPMPMPTPSTSAPAFPTPQTSGPLNIAMPRPVSFTTDSELNEYHDANSQFDDSAAGPAEHTSAQLKPAFPSPWESQEHKSDPGHRQSPPPSFPDARVGRRYDSSGQPSSPGRPSGPRNSLDHQSGPKPIVIRPMPSPPPSFPSAGVTSSPPRRPSYGTSQSGMKFSDDDDKPVIAEPEDIQMPSPPPSMPSPPSPPRYGPVRPAGRVHTMPKPGEPPRRTSVESHRRPSIEASSSNMPMPSTSLNMPMPTSSSANSGSSKLPIHLPPPPSMPAPTPHSSGFARPPSSTGHGKPSGLPPTFPSSSSTSEPTPITNILPPSTAQTLQSHNQYVDNLNSSSHFKPSGSVSSHSHSHPHGKPSGSGSVQSYSQHQHAPAGPSGSSSTGHGSNIHQPVRPGTVHTISNTAPFQATTTSKPPTTFAPSTTSTVAPAAHNNKPPGPSSSIYSGNKPPAPSAPASSVSKPPASSTPISSANKPPAASPSISSTHKPPTSAPSISSSKPPSRPPTEYSSPQHHPQPLPAPAPPAKPSNSNSGKPSKPQPSATAPQGHHPPPSSTNNQSNNTDAPNNGHHPTPPASHNDSPEAPQMSSRPHLFGGASQMDTQYVKMLLALDDIPYWYNLAASFFTWILLAGFILFPGTFTNLQAAAASNNLPVNSPFVTDAVNSITKLPLFIVAWVCTGMGMIGMAWLTWRWRKNYLWALNKIFVPGLLNSLAGLLSTLASIFGAQNGQLSGTSRVTVIVLAVSSGTFLLLVAFYSLWFVRRIKAKHDKQVGKSSTGKFGEGGVDLSKRKNR
ncbi:hypothetical protein CVT24_005608 [Panaeolus cyanescens]|uniref:Uncharacterized protein n=1 Tax=Panaeolus cyanescens TaxID=181874 RepID=A0A409YY03_9AGAR|nr:hypothetical protein CVT24_005608 [Panaeolus cyanescens]